MALRSFADLADVNRQARGRRDDIVDQPIHREARRRRGELCWPEALLPLPELDPDYRDTAWPLVHRDLRVRFDGNRYCTPAPWVGIRLALKADSGSVSLYDRDRLAVAYPRCWRRAQTLGADRFKRDLLESRPAARLSPAAAPGPVAGRSARRLLILADQSDRPPPRPNRSTAGC